jgi:branched-chain amino acid transport system substrate-binding protein
MEHLTRRALIRGGAAAAGLGAAAVLTRNATITSAGAKPAGEPIILGHQCDLTGWNAASGYWQTRAATGLVNWLNANEGIAGRPVKLVTVDTKSDVDTGINQLRQLLLNHKVDAVISCEVSSIGLASNKIANEHKTLFMSLSSAADVTSKTHAVPYQFRLKANSTINALAGAKYLVENLGKRWTIFYADYAWGQSERDWFTKAVNAAGGEVVNPIAVPVNAQDLFPYAARLDRSAKGIYIPIINALQTIQTIRSLGVKQEIVLAGGSFVLLDYRELGQNGEGVWGIESAPVLLEDMPDTEMSKVYEILGIDAEGIDKTSGKAAGISGIVGMCNTIGFIKETIEGSGWKTKDDTAKLIRYAESNTTFKKSVLFPMADVYVRPQDHQSFIDLYVVRIEKGKIRGKGRAPKEETSYPTEVDLTKSQL